MSPTLKRVLSVTSIILSGLVILLCAAGVLGAWAASGKIIEAGTNLITAAEKTAVAVQKGLESLGNGLTRLEDSTQTIEEATAQLSQNISDKGLVLVLLPPAKEAELINTIASIKETLATVEEVLSSFIETLKFIDSMPFVEVPKPKPDTLASLAVKVEKLNTSIDNVNARMQEARDNSAGAAQRISDAVGEINNDITTTRIEVKARSEQIADVQASLTEFKDSLPFWVYLGTFFMTLLFGWIIYTQVLIIQFALAKYKSA